MEERLIDYLDECLAAIQAGESVASCLSRYPEQAAELAPLLQIALKLENLPQAGPSMAVSRAAKTRFLAEAERRRASVQRPSFRRRLANVWGWLIRHLSLPTWPAPARTLATAAMSIALVLVIGGGVINAASGSLPGDPLYGFKLLGEDIQHALTFGQDGRMRLEREFIERRRAEVGQLLTLGRQEEVTFGGLLRERTGNLWQIENIPVTISETVPVPDDPVLQAFVRIHGTTQADGTVLARRVEIEGDTIVGLVEAIGPEQWRIAERNVPVDDTTSIQDQISVGDCVEVHLRRFSDGTLLALQIKPSGECQGDAEPDITPEPGETPRPTLTSTPSPRPSATPSPPSATPSRGATPTPSVTPEPEDDDSTEPEATPQLEVSPVPTSAPAGPSITPTDGSDDDGSDDNANANDNDDDSDDNANDNDSDDGDDDNANENDDDDDSDDNANENDNDGGDDDNANENDNDGGDDDNDDGDNDNANTNDSDDSANDNANDDGDNDNANTNDSNDDD